MNGIYGTIILYFSHFTKMHDVFNDSNMWNPIPRILKHIKSTALIYLQRRGS